MKSTISKLLCLVFGHKWKITYIYGASAIGKCRRCGFKKHDLINEFL